RDLLDCYYALANASPLIKICQYGTSYERRALYYLIISSKKNIARLDQLRAQNQLLSDPRRLSEAEMLKMVEHMPGTVLLSYNVHGNEAACSEAALAFVYHLLADKSESTSQ